MKKRGTVFWLKLLALLGLAVYAVNRIPFWADPLYESWSICLDYLSEGTLYGGQPYCNQAPLIFYYGLLVRTVFGESLFKLVTSAVKLALFAVIFLLTDRLAKRVNAKSSFLTPFLFLLIFYPEGARKSEMLFSTAFFLAGFEFQHHRKRGHHLLAAGALYAISLLFKYSAIYPLALSLAIQVYMTSKSGLKRMAADAAKLTAPTAILAAAFYILHPLVYVYSVLGQVANAPISWLAAFRIVFLSLNVHSLVMVALTLVYLRMLLKAGLNLDGRLYLLYPMMCIPLIAISMTRAWNFYHGPMYYALQVYPLLIASTHVLLKRDKVLFVLFLSLVFIYPTFDEAGIVGTVRSGYFSREISEFSNEIMSGLSVLPPSRRGLLMESSADDIDYIKKHGANEFLSRYGWRVNGEDNRFIYSGGEEFVGAEDPYWARRLRELTNVSMGRHRMQNGLTPAEEEIRQDIIDGRYDVILYTAHSWIVMNRVTSETPNATLGRYCKLYVPDFTHWGTGRPYSEIIYANKSVCPTGARELAAHYYKIFDEVCLRSQKAAEIIIDVNLLNGFRLAKQCNSNAVFNRWDVLNPKPLDIILTALALLSADALNGKPILKRIKAKLK